MTAVPEIRLSADDRLDILALYARYAHTIDSGDHRGWRDCFTSDGWHGDSMRGQQIVGDDLETFSETVHSEWREAGLTPRHILANVLMTPLSADDVEAVSEGLLIFTTASDEASIAAAGIYYDRIIRTPDGWRFAKRDAYIRNR